MDDEMTDRSIISTDFPTVKSIVETVNNDAFIEYITEWYSFSQDVETKLGTRFDLTDRFLKSARHLNQLIAKVSCPYGKRLKFAQLVDLNLKKRWVNILSSVRINQYLRLLYVCYLQKELENSKNPTIVQVISI